MAQTNLDEFQNHFPFPTVVPTLTHPASVSSNQKPGLSPNISSLSYGTVCKDREANMSKLRNECASSAPSTISSTNLETNTNTTSLRCQTVGCLNRSQYMQWDRNCLALSKYYAAGAKTKCRNILRGSNQITLHQVALKTRQVTECSRIRPRAFKAVVQGPNPMN